MIVDSQPRYIRNTDFSGITLKQFNLLPYMNVYSIQLWWLHMHCLWCKIINCIIILFSSVLLCCTVKEKLLFFPWHQHMYTWPCSRWRAAGSVSCCSSISITTFSSKKQWLHLFSSYCRSHSEPDVLVFAKGKDSVAGEEAMMKSRVNQTSTAEICWCQQRGRVDSSTKFGDNNMS